MSLTPSNFNELVMTMVEVKVNGVASAVASVPSVAVAEIVTVPVSVITHASESPTCVTCGAFFVPLPKRNYKTLA